MPVRKIPKNYRNLTGFIARRGGPGTVGFESSLERDFYILLDADTSVQSFDEQPVAIEYEGADNRQHTYTPDVLVVYRGDQAAPPCLCEVKYREDLAKEWPGIKTKLKAGIRYAKSRGWRFKIITEKEVRTPYLDNVKFLRRYRNAQFDKAAGEPILAVLRSCKKLAANELLDAVTSDQRQYAASITILWHLVVSGTVGCDLDKPLTMRSQLWIP